MKLTFLLSALTLITIAPAPARAATAATSLASLMGRYEGETPAGATCFVSFETRRYYEYGAGDLEVRFTDLSGQTRVVSRPSLREELSLQLRQGMNPIVVGERRGGMYGADILLSIQLDEEGRPVSASGTVDGLMHERVDCRF